LILALLACRQAAVTPVAGPSVWLESRRVGSGEALIVHAPADATVTAPEGLTPESLAPGVWSLSGPDDSYVIEVTPPGGVAIPLFADLGVDGPSGGPMEDLAAVPAPPPPVWPWIVGGAVTIAAITVLGWRAWQRLKPKPPPAPPRPAHLVAREAWAATRARTELAPTAMAEELSAIYRRYVEAAEGFPALRRTTREILDDLAASHDEGGLERARRLLGAMDLVKFAERETTDAVFERLDGDFDLLVRRA
jgi:hypothetical protein